MGNRRMDCRVKPGNDDEMSGVVKAPHV
jgi:hypothetical protein